MKEEIMSASVDISTAVTNLYLKKIIEVDTDLLCNSIFTLSGVCCVAFVMTALNLLVKILELDKEEEIEMRDVFLNMLENAYKTYNK